MPRVTRAHLEARHGQILAAAYRCFARRGFHGTTMQDVANESEVSVGTLYRYFESKDDLVEALAGRGREQKAGALEELAPGGGAAALGRMIEQVLGLLAEPGAALAARLDVRLWGESLGQPALERIVAGELEALRAPIAAFVRKERRAGRMRGDPDAVARAVVGLIAGFELQKAHEPDLDPAPYAEAARDLVASLAR